MIILRQKNYGFLARLGGNKELKKKMFKALENGRIDSQLPKDLPEDFKRYLTFLKDNGMEKKNETMSGEKGNGTTFIIFSLNTVLDQITGNSIPFNIRRPKGLKRAVIMYVGQYKLYYDCDKKNYVVSQEEDRTNLIGRAIDKLFYPKESDKIKYTSNSLSNAINWIFKSIVTYYY